MTADEMRLRARLLGNEEVGDAGFEEEADFEPLHVTDSESEADNDDDDGSINENNESRRQKQNTLMYNDSDNEDDLRLPLKPQPAKKTLTTTKKINIFDMLKTGDEVNENMEADESHDIEMDSEDIRERIAELDDSDASIDEIQATTSAKQPRKRIAIIDSDEDDSNGEDGVIEQNKENRLPNTEIEPNSEDFSSQAIRSRLAELDDSDSDTDELMAKSTKTSVNLVDTDASDVETTKIGQTLEERRQSNKRERSISEEDFTNDQTTLAGQKKKAKKMVIEDDDDD